jgi:FkbM family methyltransferase
MRIAVVTPIMKSGERGGAEALYEGLVGALRRTGARVDQVEVVIDESTCDAILESYRRCYELDLGAYDLVVSTKAPTYMVRHPNHVSYLLHTIRVFYDMFEHEFGAGTPELKAQRLLIHALDRYALDPCRIRGHFANGARTFTRLYDADPWWRTVPWRAVHHPPALTGYREPRPGKYIFLPGRLHRWKRADLVIKALAHVRADVALKISGSGEDERALRELAAGDPRVQFLGRLREGELPELYADALVVPFVPIHEDYGLITIEAFLAGKPVLTCTDSGEPTQFVKDGETGFVTEPDPRALAERLDYLTRHPEHAARMGRRGRDAIAHISWERISDALLAAGRRPAGDGAALVGAPSFQALLEAVARGRQPTVSAPARVQANGTAPKPDKHRVAVLDMQPIDPPVGGGRIRLLGLYHGLGERLPTRYTGTYDWPGEKYRRHRLSDSLEEVDIPLSPELFAVHEEWKKRAGGKTVIDVAFPLLATYSPEFVAEVRREAQEAEIVIFSHPWIYPLVKDVLRQKPQLVVYDSQNVEGFLRAMLLEDGGYGSELVRHVAEWEYDLCREADLVLACSHEDRALFHQIYEVPFGRLALAPNGTFTSRIEPAGEARRREAKSRLGLGSGPLAIFMGSAYGPNVEAAEFIIRKLAPWLPQVTFGVCGGVGPALDPALVAACGPNVHISGFLSEQQKENYFQAADLAVNPMFSGSGTNIKMLDFMAAGLPTVSTPTGARGISQAGEEAFIVCAPEKFEAAIRRAIEDGEHARRLGGAARRLAENSYSWERISRNLGALLYRRRQTLGRRPPFFTVVVPSYERHDLLNNLMDALSAQTFRDFEVVVVDQSARPWPDQGRYAGLDLLYVHTDVKGAVPARNSGAGLARGEVIAFTDDDCRPFADWLQGARGHFDDPGVVGVEGLIVSDKREDPNYRAVTNVDFEGIGFMTANLFVRREAFLELDGFDPQFDRPHFREDTDLGWRAQALGRIPFGHDVRVYHPPHRRDIEREGMAERNRFFEKDALLLKKHPARYRDLFLMEGHYRQTPGFRENFLRGLDKYGVRADDFYLNLLPPGPAVSAGHGALNGSRPVQPTSDKRFDGMLENFKALLEASGPMNPGRQLNPVDGFFAYRLLLGRNPDSNGELTELITSQETYRQFLTRLVESPEYRHSSGIFPADRLLMGETEGVRFWFNSSDREMGVLMALGMYEPRLVGLLKRLVRAGMTCLDLGAQSGFYTCLMASLVGEWGKVHAFEPMPASYELLVRNVRENDFDGRVSAYRLGASDQVRTVEGSLVSGMYVVGQVGGTKASFDCVPVDDVVRGRVDLVKMDVEGHEPAALRGMKDLIRVHQPVILSEVNEYWLRTCSGTSARGYVDSLIDMGYEVYPAERPDQPIRAGTLNLEVLDAIDVIAVPARMRARDGAGLGAVLAPVG